MALVEVKWSEIVSKKKLKLKEEDFLQVYECLSKVPDKWRQIGLYLRLPMSTIKVIVMDHATTWEHLINALMKVGVLSHENLHQQPAARLEISERIIWEVKLKVLHNKQIAYQSHRVTVRKKLNIFISDIRSFLKVPNDISEDVLIGSIEEYLTFETSVMSRLVLIDKITEVVKTYQFSREVLMEWTALLQDGSSEACNQLETLVKLSGGAENEIKEIRADNLERGLQHVATYCEHISPALVDSQQDVASALVKNTNLKYRLDQMRITSKQIMFNHTLLFFQVVPILLSFLLRSSLDGINPVASIGISTVSSVIIVLFEYKYFWYSAASKFRPLVLFCGAVVGVNFSQFNLMHQVSMLSIFPFFPYILSYGVGVMLASAGAVVWNSFDRGIRLVAVLYCIVISLCWGATVSKSLLALLLGMACGFVILKLREFFFLFILFLMSYCSSFVLAVPGFIGFYVSKYTTAQCGILIAAIAGGLTALWLSVVLSSTTIPLYDTDLSNAMRLLDENLLKLRSLQRGLEETQKRLKRSMPSLN